MTSSEKFNNTVLKLSNEHTIILGLVAELEEAGRVFTDQDFYVFLRERIPYASQELHRHFYYEESAFFPALLQCIHTETVIRDILIIQKQHGVIEGFFHHLQLLLDSNSLVESRIRTHFAPELRNMIELIKAHALMEIQKIFPLIAQNPLALKTLEKKIADLTLS